MVDEDEELQEAEDLSDLTQEELEERQTNQDLLDEEERWRQEMSGKDD